MAPLDELINSKEAAIKSIKMKIQNQEKVLRNMDGSLKTLRRELSVLRDAHKNELKVKELTTLKRRKTADSFILNYCFSRGTSKVFPFESWGATLVRISIQCRYPLPTAPREYLIPSGK